MTDYNNKRSEEIKQASGQIVYSDPLTTFFYLLLRNELAAGKVEEIVREVVDPSSEECTFSNGWLAQYAHNLAEEIRTATTKKLVKNLEKAFVENFKSSIESEAKSDLETDENWGGDALFDLEHKLESLANGGKVIGDESIDEIAMITSEEAVTKAKISLQKLVDEGHMTQKEADGFKKDVDLALEKASPETIVKPKQIPDAEEIHKEHNEDQKWTPEHAKTLVETAMCAFEIATKPKSDQDSAPDAECQITNK